MTYKIYAIENYFIIEIAGTAEPKQDSKARVNVWIKADSPREYHIESPLLGDHDILLSDMQDQSGTPYTQGTWDTFYQANSGFNPASGGSGAVDSVAGKTGVVVLDTADINTPNDGTSTHATSSKEWFNHVWSAASLNGFDITENGDGTVTLTDGDIVIRSADVHDSELKTFKVIGGISGTGFPAIADNDQNFIYCQYNAGTPNLAVTTDPESIDGRTEFPIWMVTRIGNDTHVVDLRGYSNDFAQQESRKTFFVNGFEHQQGGTVTTEAGTRNLNVTAGVYYILNKKTPHIAFDTSIADSFMYLSTSDSGATWTRSTGQTQIDNLQYNNPATGLVTLANNNKFGVHWVFIVLNNPDLLFVIYGQAEYANEADAGSAKLPSILPPEVQAYSTGVLIAKVIIQKSASSFADIQTPFESQLTSQSANTHNSLGGLNVGDYQHLTAVEKAKFDNLQGSDINMSEITGALYSTSQEAQNTLNSAGLISGGAVSDGGANTIDVSAAELLIRATNDFLAPLLFAKTSVAVGLSIPINTTRYIGIEYNAGTPQIVVKATETFDFNTDFILSVVTNEAGTMQIANAPHSVNSSPGKLLQRIDEVFGVQRDNSEGGLLLGETGTRNVTMTAGSMWNQLRRATVSAVDTSVSDTFNRYYQDNSGGFTIELLQTQWNNTQYDDGSGALATLGANKYAVQWWYITLGGFLLCMYGREEHNSFAAAEDEPVPANGPIRITDMSILLGKFIFKKDDATLTKIESAFDTSFGGANVVDHNSLGSLQGGIAGEYYHISAAQHAKLLNILARPWKRVFYGYNMVTAVSYTWNGIAGISAPAATSLFDRHRFFAFAGNASNKEGVYVNFVLPTNYTAGNNIKITAKTSSNVAGGDYVFTVGVAQPSSGGAFSDDTDSEFVEVTKSTALGWNVESGIYVFDGTNMSPGDPISIMVYRDAQNAGDTETSDVYLNSILIEEI